jgi:phenylacetate-CoA ligase
VTPEEYGRSFNDRIGQLAVEAAKQVPLFAGRLIDAGLEPAELTTVETLDRLPVMSKDELLVVQSADRPFGGLLAADARVRRIFQSPGPLYEPELEALDHWRWSPALEAAGFGPDDVVLNAFGYHMSPAGAMFDEGARARGCCVIPGGIGNMELQVHACADARATAYIGLPSYLKALLEKADELDVALGFNKAFVTAEPLPPSLRAWLEDRVGEVAQGYGTAEAGNLGFECRERTGLHVPRDALVQIADLESGTAIWDGGEGEVVVTLFHPDYPLVRFGTGDLSAFLVDPCPCGLPTPRLAGWLGRVGDAVKVRGMFLHPRQVRNVMEAFEGVSGYRFIVDRREHRDQLTCEVVTDGSVPVESVRERVRSALRFNISVVEVDSLPQDVGPIEDRRSWE